MKNKHSQYIFSIQFKIIFSKTREKFHNILLYTCYYYYYYYYIYKNFR